MSSTGAAQAETQRTSLDSKPGHQACGWLRARVRLMPGALNQSPPWVRGVFDHSWAPMEAMARQVCGLPPALWDFLLSCNSGFVAITTGDSRYVLGPATLRHQPVLNAAYVSVADLAQDNERPLHTLGHLIDHHMGCGGAANGAWLSEGGGLVSDWKLASQRLPPLFTLGYGMDEIAQSSLQDYFAQSLALFCRDRQRLNAADPQIYRWLRTTLWQEAFWQVEKNERGSGL